MVFTFKPDTPYLMPAHFGKHPLFTDVAHYEDTTNLMIPYVTDKDALASFLPKPLEPTDVPLVAVTCAVCKGVSFLGGGDYNFISINLAAVFNGQKDHVTGSYWAVLWENDTFPILLGRELLGAPKLYAEIPNPRQEDNNWSFYCTEYGTRLIKGEIKNTAPVDEATLKQLEERANARTIIGWKYIPSPDLNGEEISFPTAVTNKRTLRQAWFG